MTREEIVAFIKHILEINPDAFLEPVCIEKYYIYMPALEFVKDMTTGKWRAY